MGARPGSPGLRARALQWLGQREHSRQELRLKLLRWQQRAAQRLNGDAQRSPNPNPDADTDADADGGAAPFLDAEGRAQAVDTLLDELVARGLLSDRRYAESRVHARAARFGTARVEGELRLRGVVPPPEMLEQLRATELERARAVLRARGGRAGPPGAPTAGEIQRLRRFLAGRGFSAETIRAVLREAPDED